MDTPTVLSPTDSRNGSDPDLFPPLHAVALATLTADVDKLLEMRDTKRKLDADERALTRRVPRGAAPRCSARCGTERPSGDGARGDTAWRRRRHADRPRPRPAGI